MAAEKSIGVRPRINPRTLRLPVTGESHKDRLTPMLRKAAEPSDGTTPRIGVALLAGKRATVDNQFLDHRSCTAIRGSAISVRELGE
jgi:hypothetical protein